MKKNLSFICALSLCIAPFATAAGSRAVPAVDIESEERQVESAPVEAASEESSPEAAQSPENAFREDAYMLKHVVKQSQFLYREALMHFEQGNRAKAGELFRQSLEALNSDQLPARMRYRLKGVFDTFFEGLDRELSSAPSADPARDGKYRILLDRDNELVKRYLEVFTQGKPKQRIQQALERSGRYRDMILGVLKEYDLPRELVYLPVVESLYNNNDRSRVGALGLWQLMPERARALGLKVNYWVDERKDPEKATRAAARYLKELHTMFDDWHLALAAYNRGEYGLARDLNFARATNIEQMATRRAVPRETERFVPQFIACTLIGDNPEEFGFEPDYQSPVAYDEVAIDKVIDLEIAAKCAETTVNAVRELNPSLGAWCTPHNHPGFRLCLPAGSRERFLANVALVKDLNPSRGVIKYKVVKGDWLEKIATRFATTPSAIKADNPQLRKSKYLKIGQVLVVRPGRKYLAKARS